MSIAPPPEGVAQPPRCGQKASPGVAAAADGFVVTCVCAWLRWWPDLEDAKSGQAKHEKTCKGEVVKAIVTPKRSTPRNVKWADRGENSWIDKL